MVPNGAENRAVAEVVQAMAAEAGFDLKIRVTEFATSLKQAEKGEYQAYLIGWSGRTDPDGNSYIFHTCKAPQNNAGYCDKEVDRLRYDEARATAIRARAQGGLREGRRARYLAAKAPIIYLYHRQVLIAQTRQARGLHGRCRTGWCAWSALKLK